MGLGASLGRLGEYKQAFSKYKSLQKSLSNLVIRAKEGSYVKNGETLNDAIVIDMTGEMKIRDFKINDESLLSPSNKTKLEELVISCFQKAQTKAQEVSADKMKDILGVDPNNLGALGDMLGGLGK